jgi:hypothetical protein
MTKTLYCYLVSLLPCLSVRLDCANASETYCKYAVAKKEKGRATLDEELGRMHDIGRLPIESPSQQYFGVLRRPLHNIV